MKELIHDNHPSIDLRITNKEKSSELSCNSFYLQDSSVNVNLISELNESHSSIIIPLNSILHLNGKNEVVVDEINYPWDFLKGSGVG